jgi:hypothetical protein
VDYRKEGSSEVGREIELSSVFANFPETVQEQVTG